MVDVWLAQNRRVLLLGMVLPALGAVAGGVLLYAGWNWTGGILLTLGLVLVLSLALQLNRPRIGFQNGHLLFYLRTREPIAVPLEVVEGFLLGQGPTLRPGERHRTEQTRTIVVRLAEKAEDWARREVKPALGSWCEGYITIRGTWCEPLDVDLVQNSIGNSPPRDSRNRRHDKLGTGKSTATRLLISVRNAAEAQLALSAGVSLLDVKEPVV